MKNAASIQRKINEIKTMTDTPKAIGMLADMFYDEGMSACEERGELAKQLFDMRKMILGNGDPTTSILARVVSLEVCMGKIEKSIDRMLIAIMGSTDPEKPIVGLGERMRVVEKVHASLIKLAWLVMGVLVTEITLRLIGIL